MGFLLAARKKEIENGKSLDEMLLLNCRRLCVCVRLARGWGRGGGGGREIKKKKEVCD
jgi:hypothetical protein